MGSVNRTFQTITNTFQKTVKKTRYGELTKFVNFKIDRRNHCYQVIQYIIKENQLVNDKT